MSKPEFRLYDSHRKDVVPLETKEPGVLRFYSCGPTVYSYAHIGNFRTFLTSDLVVRTATELGWDVLYVTNITDVGHLTQDDVADAAGEDRMAKALKSKAGENFRNIWDLAEYYAGAFIEDWRSLNLVEPYVRPKATQHMREQIQHIQALIDKGHAYVTPTGVYFSVNSFPSYGELSGNVDRASLQGARDVVQDDNKRDPADFALWKKDDQHLMQWYSPWGWGFPGWHIECSAMAQAYLGDEIDLHGGGEDLLFPHHEAERAQSECLTGKVFVRHWIHTRFLRVDGDKMAKSTGNVHTVRELVDQGVDPITIRFALISVPYRKPLNFSDQSLNDAKLNISRLREAWAKVSEATDAPLDPSEGTFGRLYTEMLEAMCDDLNTSVAISKAVEGAKLILREGELDDSAAQQGKAFLAKVESLLGLLPAETSSQSEDATTIDSQLDEIITRRDQARADKNFAEADRLRDLAAEMGYEIRDTPDGTKAVKI